VKLKKYPRDHEVIDAAGEGIVQPAEEKENRRVFAESHEGEKADVSAASRDRGG
jgi:hypothetical protein